MFPGLLSRVIDQLKQRTEVIKLGKVYSSKELVCVVEDINRDIVKVGEATWRLPTAEELLSHKHGSNDGSFGLWLTWAGDSYYDFLAIVNMSPRYDDPVFYDSDGTQVEAYLVKTGFMRQ